MNKKIIKSALICIVVIVALILVENAIRGSAKVVEHVKNSRELAKEQREYEKTENYTLDNYVKNAVNTVINYMNSGDYKSIYDKLDPSYKDFKQYITVDDFKQELEKYIGTYDTIEFMGYKAGNGKYDCRLSVTSNEKLNIKRILIISNKDDFYIIPDDVDEIVKGDEKYFFEDRYMNFNIVYETKYPGYKVYSVDITNITSNTLEGSFADTYIYRTDGINYKAQDDESLNVKIQPKETVRMNIITKNTQSSSYATDSYMEVIFKDKNEKIIAERAIVLDYEYIEDYM